MKIRAKISHLGTFNLILTSPKLRTLYNPSGGHSLISFSPHWFWKPCTTPEEGAVINIILTPLVLRALGTQKGKHSLKGVWHEIFDFRFFSCIIFPGPPSIPMGPFRIFFANSRRYSQMNVYHRCQRHWRWVVHRCQRHRRQFIAGDNDTSKKLIAGDKNKDAKEVGSCQG